MPFGILDCKRMEVVPGTAFMSDQDELPPEYSDIAKEQLKHGKGRYRDVILVPQPSDNPNDPLNWAQWRKEVVLLIVSLTAAVVGAYGPMLSPGFVQVSAELHITVEILSQATAWLTLTIGLSLFLTNPLAKMIGRRPIYVASVAILLASSVWGAAVTHYGSFLASRVVAGVGMAPFEVLVQCTIGDLYFVHERATRIAVWNLFLLAGIAGGSLISGYTIEHDGYRWTFGVCAVLFGLLMVAIVLLVPETAFRRHAGPAVPVPVPVPVLVDGAPHSASEKGAAGGTGGAAGVSTDVVAVQEKKHTFLRSLRVFTGRYTDAPMCKIFVRPVVMWFYPAVLWGFLVYGTSITWIVVFSVVNGVIFVAPPYNFTVSQTGLISLSPLVLTVLGEAVSGPLNDWVCVRLTRANRGVYEPEFRLPLMAVSVVLGAVGFFGFGATVAAQTHWTGPVLCFGLANMSLVFGATCVFGYIIDSYRSHNEEAFVAINSRNLLTFGMTYFVNSWLAAQGTLVVFSMLGALFLFVCLLTVPLWIFGKKMRSWIGRNEWLRAFMNDD